MFKSLLISLALVAAVVTTVSGAETAPPTGGVVCLTFDDRNFDDWVKALEIVDRSDARATFFVCGKIDDATAAKIKQLTKAGHAIGSHGMNHQAAVKYASEHSAEDYFTNEVASQLEMFKSHGIEVSGFAYPSSSRNSATDRALAPLGHLRSGIFPPKGKRLAEMDAAFVPVDKIAETRVFNGRGIDTNASYDPAQIDEALERAAKNRELIVFYAHDIAESARGHHLQPAELERILKKGRELGLEFRSFAELP